jgi:hypothetical protein
MALFVSGDSEAPPDKMKVMFPIATHIPLAVQETPLPDVAAKLSGCTYGFESKNSTASSFSEKFKRATARGCSEFLSIQ